MEGLVQDTCKEQEHKPQWGEALKNNYAARSREEIESKRNINSAQKTNEQLHCTIWT